MALPPGIKQVAVTVGPYTDFITGDPIGGTVTFQPQRWLIWKATGTPLVALPVQITLDTMGMATVYLPATDQDGFVDDLGQPIKNFTYTVTLSLSKGSAQPSMAIVLPQDVTTVDLDTLIPRPTSNGVVVARPEVASVVGRAGIVTATHIKDALVAIGFTGGGGTDGGGTGESAYEIATRRGFVGTEDQWLESLEGAQGPQGRGFIPRGAWSVGSVYAIDDLVVYLGSIYRVRTPHTAVSGTVPGSNAGTYELWASAGPVTSVAGRTGAVTVTKTDVGLSNVSNLTDADRPVSSATKALIDALSARLAAVESGSGGATPTNPTSPPVTATGTPAKWWIEYGQLPHTRMTYETRASSATAATVAWVASTPDARVPTSLLEVDVPVLPQTAWEAYLEDMTATGTRAVESGIVESASDRWTPSTVNLTPGRTYRAWARTRVGSDRWSPWASTRFVVPTGKIWYFEDFGAVGDGVNVDGADYQASPAITFGPIRQAIAACNPGDTVKSKQPGIVLRGVGASGTTLTSSSSVFTSAMVGKKVKVYGAGTYEGNYTLSGSNPVVVTIDKTATAVHRATIQSVASDGKSAVISTPVTTAGTGYKVLVGGPTYLINHLDIDGNLGNTNGGRGGMTIDFTGCETISTRETSAGMRITIPLTTVIEYHHTHVGAGFRGNGKNGDSGGTFVEGTNAYGNRWFGCWMERGRDAGFLWYSGPTDQFIVDCTADHTNADPFHVTAKANDIYFIRPVSIYCGDDLGNIGYRTGGDSERPYNIYWESPVTYGQDWGRTLAYGGTYRALATDVYIDGGAMANFLVGSDGDQANTNDCQIRRFKIVRSRIRSGQKAYYSQGANAGTIQDSMWLKLLVNKGTNTVRQGNLLIEKGQVTDGKFMQIVCYNGGEFNDATTILRGIVMDGDVNAGLSWVDQGTYNNHIDLRGITPTGRTAITTAPSAANGTPPGSATSTTAGTSTPPADTTRPSAPTNLAVARPSSGTNVVSWTAGTDDVGVAGYNVYGTVSGGTPTKLNGTLVTGTSYSHGSTTNGSNYYYEVETVDTAGNVSASRPNVSTSGPFVSADTTKPSNVTGLAVTRPASGRNDLSWNAATDNVAIAGYNVYGSVSGGTPAKLNSSLITGTTYSHTGTTNGSNYYYEVEAVDTAGNVSASRTNVSTTGAYVAPATGATATPPPSTTAARLMYVDTAATTQDADLRITDMKDEVTGKAFSWATDAERPIVRVVNGRKVAEFLNGRALLEGTGIAGKSAITVTLIMAQHNLVTALRSGYISAVAANANDYDKTAGQWAIGGPGASNETAWASLTVSGAPQSSGVWTGFSRALDVMAVVQVSMSMDGTAPSIWVDGVQLTTSATNPTTSGLLFLDRILLGARWFDGGPKDGQQFRLGAFFIHEGRISATDRTSIRSWSNTNFSTPAP